MNDMQLTITIPGEVMERLGKEQIERAVIQAIATAIRTNPPVGPDISRELRRERKLAR